MICGARARGTSAVVAAMWFITACGGSSSPSQPTVSPKANIGVASIAAEAEALSSGGYAYRVGVKLRESGGVAAPIVSLDLALMHDGITLVSTHEDRPISETANVVPANGTVDSREITLTDTDLSHPPATSVTARVSFTDGPASTKTATGSADIAAPAPALFTVSGTVSDESSGRMLPGGTIEIVDGVNAGKTTASDGAGTYALSGLSAGSFVIRATSHGYNPREDSVTVARDTTLDLRLRPIPASPPPSPSPSPPPSPGPCVYTVSPAEAGAAYSGGNLTATISRTSGSCSWQGAADENWITFPAGASGNGSGSLTYTLAPNPTFSSRVGRVTVSWAGGSAQVRVLQGHHPDWECIVSLTTPQDVTSIPSAGAQFTVTASVSAFPPEWNGIANCGAQVTTSVPWISGGGSVGSMPVTFTFTVAPNPSPGTTRSGTITATTSSRTQTITVTQR